MSEARASKQAIDRAFILDCTRSVRRNGVDLACGFCFFQRVMEFVLDSTYGLYLLIFTHSQEDKNLKSQSILMLHWWMENTYLSAFID